MEKDSLLKRIYYFRRTLARKYSLHKIKNQDFTIISDNCWGRNLYNFFELPANSPTIGIGVSGKYHYLDFIENLHQKDFCAIQKLDSSYCDSYIKRVYPVGQSPYAMIHFLHYPSFEVAIRCFHMRYRKINWDNMFYKVDFDFFNQYTTEDIERWNQMALPNSVAFYSDDTRKIYQGYIHHGLYIKKKKSKNNNSEFGDSQKYFDYIHWLNTGEVECSFSYRFINFILLDISVYLNISRFKQRVKGMKYINS